MALLTVKQRAKRFKYLGLGSYNKKNILRFQKKAFPGMKSEHDSEWGSHSDRALRHFYNVKRYAPNFKPEDFKCDCGHCNGYPSYMKKVTLQHLQYIRYLYNKPITVTSGLRCKHANSSSVGSIQNSRHLIGYAVDFYQKGVTDTLANRKKSMKRIKQLPNHHYSYGNRYNSYGYYVDADYMGNAMHTDVNKESENPLKPWFDMMKVQFNWSKNQKYEFLMNPTVANSKEKGTCITFWSVTLQILGLLPSSKFFYLNPKTNRMGGNGASYVKSHKDIYKYFYPNKTVKQLWKEGKIKVGDMCGFDDPAYHSMVFMGFNSKNEPIWNTMGHKRGLMVTYDNYANRKVAMIVRLKKVKK